MAQVGVQQYADGSQVPVRSGRFGELIVNTAVGEYYELSRQGRIFHASMQAGAGLGTALTASAVTWTLYNPSGSGVLLSLIQTTVAMTASQVAAAIGEVVVYGGNFDPSAAIPTSTTQIVTRPAVFGGNASSYGKVFSAATLPATPVIVRTHPFGVLCTTQALASDSPSGGTAALDFVNGAIVLLPNTAVTLQGIGSTQITGIISGMWAEIPL